MFGVVVVVVAVDVDGVLVVFVSVLGESIK